MRKLLILILGMGFTIQSQAFTCFLTIVKANCWSKYTVDVTAKEPVSGKVATTVTVPEDEFWAREQFTCQPGETLSVSAVFSPVFWQQDVGKNYPAVHDWKLPTAIKKDEKAWNITICYPDKFSGVPLPPDVGGDCTCKIDKVPPVAPM